LLALGSAAARSSRMSPFSRRRSGKPDAIFLIGWLFVCGG
jgi:hypothetical protein